MHIYKILNKKQNKPTLERANKWKLTRQVMNSCFFEGVDARHISKLFTQKQLKG